MVRKSGLAATPTRRFSSIPVRLGLALAMLAGLLVLTPASPTRADLTPGHLDTGFDASVGGPVYAVAAQADGKVLIGGDFTTVNGTGRNRIARLNGDGTLDTSFDPGAGANAIVYGMAVQADGKVLIGGNFITVNGTGRNRIARLNADGTLDTSFDPGAGANGLVLAVVAQADGKVLIGGNFTTVNGTGRDRIARLNGDGTLDTSFDPGAGANSWVWAVAVQADGKVLIGGDFATVNGTGRNRIARLNADGTLDTSFDPGAGADVLVYAVAVQADGKALIGGDFTTVNGTGRNRIARLNSDGALDTGFDPGTGANNSVYALAVQADGKVLIAGDFNTFNGGLVGSSIARLNGDGTLDADFDPGVGANNWVWAVAVRGDGKVLIGGNFTTVNGTVRNRIARLNGDGTLDTGFDTSIGANAVVYGVAVQPDGKVLIGGHFTTVNGTGRNRIARLNGDGTLDTSFDPGTGADGDVWAVAVQADGKVLIGGYFTTVDGTARERIARLNGDGTLDTGFDTSVGANAVVWAVAVQPDGKVLIGGDFTTVNGTGRNHIARLNDDGTLDTGFDPGAGANDRVQAVTVQPDGKVLIGGDFTTVNGTARNRIARLNDDGTLDSGFDPGTGANALVYAVAIQADGKVLIGGEFTTVSGTSRNAIARLNGDGTLDTGFDPGAGANDWVKDVAVQPDGKVLIGGDFTTVNGTGRNRIARLNGDGTLDTGFDPGAGANYWVSAVAIQADGKVLIGGGFDTVDGTARKRIARLNGATPPVFASAAPATATLGTVYSYTFAASGFPVPTFHVTSGSLPPSLTLDATSGVLSGIPSVVGTYSFTVRASNYVAPSDTQAVALVVNKATTYLPLVVRNASTR